jgi:hypothetical protein
LKKSIRLWRAEFGTALAATAWALFASLYPEVIILVSTALVAGILLNGAAKVPKGLFQSGL